MDRPGINSHMSIANKENLDLINEKWGKSVYSFICSTYYVLAQSLFEKFTQNEFLQYNVH